jgi:hypothetical protein
VNASLIARGQFSASANRRFQFQKRSQYFIRSHNETLSVAAMCVSNPDRSPFEISYLGKNRHHRPLSRPIRPKEPAIRIVFSSGGNRGRVAFFFSGASPHSFLSDAFFPFGDCAKFRSRSHDAVIRVYDATGNMIETHEHAGDFQEW